LLCCYVVQAFYLTLFFTQSHSKAFNDARWSPSFYLLFLISIPFFIVYFLFTYFTLLPYLPASEFTGFPVYQTSIWALLYFFHAIYTLFFFSAVFYLLPNLSTFTGASGFASSTHFTSVDGVEVMKLFLTPILLLLLLHSSWHGPAIVSWFGHVLFSAFQYKITYLLFIFFVTYVSIFLTSVHFSYAGVYDYAVTIFNFFIWLWLMFFSNNLFTFVFFLELLSALVTLTLITSTFSSFYFYNPLSYSKHSYFQVSTPTALLQTMLMFFWTSLITSLLLFLFLITFYLQFLTFDWNLVDSVFSFIVSTSSLKSVFAASFSWLLMLVCVFTKCGIVPFFLWKPAFFKGMTFTALFFYVYVYYFAVFLFFVNVTFLFINELFVFNLYLVIFLIVSSTILISSILFESFYVKSFLALSSILNSVLIFYALCGFQATDVIFTL